jgi:hypothetical protein
MNLKEAYQYANYLDNLKDTALLYLSDKSFITTTTENHQRSKTNSEATDEVIETPKSSDVEFTPDEVVDFLTRIFDEKESLAKAIAIAKENAEINIDTAISLNKQKQNFVKALNFMANVKSSETQTRATDYKFNNDGDQVSYYYPVIKTTVIDYNRNSVRGLARKITKETNEVSSKIDSIEINTTLDFAPKYDITNTFEEAILI